MTAAQLERAGGPQGDRLVVKTGSLGVRVDDVGATAREIGSLAREGGGYLETSTVRGDRSAHLVVRVPSEKLEAVMDAVAKLGAEQSRSLTGEDVTEQYFDLDVRLKNALALRERLQSLLEKATKVEEMIQIERELARVQNDVETLQGRIDRLKSRLQFSTLVVTLERRQVLGPLGYLTYGLWWALKKLFVLK